MLDKECLEKMSREEMSEYRLFYNGLDPVRFTMNGCYEVLYYPLVTQLMSIGVNHSIEHVSAEPWICTIAILHAHLFLFIYNQSFIKRRLQIDHRPFAHSGKISKWHSSPQERPVRALCDA